MYSARRHRSPPHGRSIPRFPLASRALRAADLRPRRGGRLRERAVVRGCPDLPRHPADHHRHAAIRRNRLLRRRTSRNPRDGRAAYYLGNLFYEQQPERAIELWEQARELEPSLAIVHRNLGWAYHRHEQNPPKAIASYEQAIETRSDDPRYYLELDDLYELANTSPQTRLTMLQRNASITNTRKDLLIRKIRLLVINRATEPAIDALTTNQFHISEGGGATPYAIAGGNGPTDLGSVRGQIQGPPFNHNNGLVNVFCDGHVSYEGLEATVLGTNNMWSTHDD